MPRRVAILVGNGDLAAAYKTLNIATAAAAMEAEVVVFFTFGGVGILNRAANGSLPAQPGAEGIGRALAGGGAPPVPELLTMARDLGVRLIACQVTLDLLGISEAELVEGVEFGGAAAYLDFALGADVTLSF